MSIYFVRKKLLNAMLWGILLGSPGYAAETVLSAQDFSDTMALVKSDYVEEVSDNQLFEGAIEGMLEELDPHSTYLNEREYQELKTLSEGKLSGIGLEVMMKKTGIYVITPVDGSPAQKAGVLSGDNIVSIDHESVMGLSLEDAVDLMHGQAGTRVNLELVRESEKDLLHFDLIRAPLDIENVKGELLDKKYAYLRISSFQEGTAQKVDEVLKQLSTKGKLEGVILDLRNNPGGLLDEAVNVSDIFLAVNSVPYDKVIVTTKGRNGSIQSVAKVSSPDHINGIPMVALINHGTASAAEIVAAALQDDNRAIVMGTRSFGKGSVQTIFPLPGGKTAVKLTTARYYTPKGRPIQAGGVTPDVIVEQATVLGIKPEDNMVNAESALPGHLAAEKSKSLSDEKSLSGQDDNPLLKKDFQLHQALMVLEGTVSLEK